MADSKEKLFSDFSPVSTEQWMEKVTADLKGADFEKKLVWRTNEGFKVKPFYRMEDLEGLKTTDALPGEFPYLRGTKKNNNEWFVRQEIKVESPEAANAKALDILNKGVDSLSFHVKAKELSAEYIETLLKDICAECIELNFSTCQGHVVELAQLLVGYFQKKDYDLTKLQGSINYDYFNKMLAKGKEKGDMVATAKALIEATAMLPKYRVLNVNALTLNNAGAYIYQELGYALAWGNEYMNQLIIRSSCRCYLVMVTMETAADTLPHIEEIEQALSQMEQSIRQTIRRVDVCTRYSAMQYLIILFEPIETQIPNIMDRIFIQYYKHSKSHSFQPGYEYLTMTEMKENDDK